MHESMLYTNLSGCLVALVLAILSGHLFGGIKFCQAHPEVRCFARRAVSPACGERARRSDRPFPISCQALAAILVYSLASAVGQNFVYFTVTEFGPLILTTVTTTRKIFSTLYSVLHPLPPLLPDPRHAHKSCAHQRAPPLPCPPPGLPKPIQLAQ